MLLSLLLAVYAIALVILSLVSTNRYVLVTICRKHAHRRRESLPPLRDAEAPTVTIQLPIYNERYVVERLIRSACSVDYPRDRLSIQVLDDSTDDTLDTARALVRDWRERGVDIVHLHRDPRTGFKAGALAYGLERTASEFVAVFDADFVIPRDFLRRMLPYFRDAATGIVQSRWTYLNEDYSPLTRATVIGLDAEFGIEQPGRCWGGMFLGFNGTGAVLRTQSIREAGGWKSDTITEDLDLSYRAQLAGWRIQYISGITCPSEIPADVHGLKAQQFRWTKGTQETARKLLPRLWRSREPFWIKLQGTLHLLANSTYPFLLLIGILNPLMVLAAHARHIHLAWPLSVYFLFSSFGTYSYHAEAVHVLHDDWRRRMLYFPLFLGQAIGLSVVNSKAAIDAWLGRKSPFLRTPKYDLTKPGQRWHTLRYRSRFSWSVAVELLLGIYSLAAVAYAISTREYGALPFLLLFGFGYLLLAYYSVRHQLLLRPAGALAAAARAARRAAVIVLAAALATVALRCSGSDRRTDASAGDVLLDDAYPSTPPPGFLAVALLPSDSAGYPAATGSAFYRASGDTFDWYVSAGHLRPGRHYRVELNVDDSLNFAVGALTASAGGELLGHGSLSRFADRYCVGNFVNPPTSIAGTHWIGIRIKEDGSGGGGMSLTGPALPCTGNADHQFTYVLHERQLVEFEGAPGSAAQR